MTRESAARRMIAAITVTSLAAVALPATADEAATKADRQPAAEAIQALKKGGYVIYMRHTLTDTSTVDQVQPADLENCSIQRNLTAEGRSQAVEIGKAMRKQGIPVGEVLSSPYCRTRETAKLAFGKYLESHGLLNTANLTDQEKAPIVAELRSLLGRPVPPGSNRVLVSHSAPLADATGIFPKPQGVVVVFKLSSAGGVRHIATIDPGDWEKTGVARR